MTIKNIIFDFGNVFIEWNPHLIFSRIFQKEELDSFMHNIWNEEWNNNQDGGITFAENKKILQAKHPLYNEYIDFFYTHWYESLGEENWESLAILASLQQAGSATYGLTNWSAKTFPPTVEKHPFSIALQALYSPVQKKYANPIQKSIKSFWSAIACFPRYVYLSMTGRKIRIQPCNWVSKQSCFRVPDRFGWN